MRKRIDKKRVGMNDGKKEKRVVKGTSFLQVKWVASIGDVLSVNSDVEKKNVELWLHENPEEQYRENLECDGKRDYEIDDDNCLKEENELAISNQQTNQERRNVSSDPKIWKQNEWMKIINKTLSENKLCFKEGNKSKYDNQEKKDFLFLQNEIKRLIFLEFVKKKMNYIRRQTRTFAVDMCTHLPTSFMSLRVVKILFECLDCLKVLAEMLSNNSITDQEFNRALAIS
ncbi:hypothetical protein Fmac_031731 [Flemingia macrophylla]|uniref:Uncharacterized protein n=1 Tax=Flemingia macrophylla TaxID=520843 RepID=A0ABD1L485_9FABA